MRTYLLIYDITYSLRIPAISHSATGLCHRAVRRREYKEIGKIVTITAD